MNEILDFLNLIGLGGVAIFLKYLFKGLRTQIITLSTTVEQQKATIEAVQVTVNEQKVTIEAVRERAEEYSVLSQGYKKALADFQEMGENLNTRRKEVMCELEDAVKRKDTELIQLRKIQIQEIELKQKSLDSIPKIAERLSGLAEEMSSKLEILDNSEFNPFKEKAIKVEKCINSPKFTFSASDVINSYLKHLKSEPSPWDIISVNPLNIGKTPPPSSNIDQP